MTLEEYKHNLHLLKVAIKGLGDRKEVETGSVLHKELRDIDFKVEFDKYFFVAFAPAYMMIPLYLIKSYGYDLWNYYFYGKPWELSMGDKIGLGFVSICGSFIIVLFSALLLMKPIHVKRSTVYQKNKCWHYMELSKVVVTKTRICRVYSEGKMIFWHWEWWRQKDW